MCLAWPLVNGSPETDVNTGSKGTLGSKKGEQCSLVVKWWMRHWAISKHAKEHVSYSRIAGLITIFVSVCIFSYEPEIHPAASYRIKNLRSTVQVFSTGSITVTGKPLTQHSPSIIFTTIIWVYLECTANIWTVEEPLNTMPVCNI